MVKLREDGGVAVALTVDAIANIAEVNGFKELTLPELLEHLDMLGREQIERNIRDCFARAADLEADIFEFCTMVSKQHPKQWSDMQPRWREIFPDIDLNIQVGLRIVATGQIGQSLQMEGHKK